jgi:hypothetical protein
MGLFIGYLQKVKFFSLLKNVHPGGKKRGVLLIYNLEPLRAVVAVMRPEGSAWGW